MCICSCRDETEGLSVGWMSDPDGCERTAALDLYFLPFSPVLVDDLAA